MSLVEFIGEAFNPGPVGEVGLNGHPKRPKDRFRLLKFVIAVVVLAAAEYFAFRWFAKTGGYDLLIFHGLI